VTRMLREHAGRTPVMTVHNGVPVVDSPPATPDDFVVGTIGHISRTKGTDIFLRAAELALRADPDLRFEHLGPARLWGDDEFDGLVEALGASPALHGAVRMLGPGPASEALPRWSIFVLASRQEAFPLSTLEAMAAGLPVIATSVGGIPEQIVHGESGILVAPEDPAALAEWIARLREDADLRSRLALGGRQRAREAFPLRGQAEELDHAYALAVERRVAARRSLRLT
jgi:glycosyltransferase involved in cell wall biosynthesis